MKLIHICGPWPLCTNTFLLVSAAGHAVAIDPAARVQNYLDQLSQAGATLSDIFLTHGHFDHIFGASFVYDTYGVPIELCDAERQTYESSVDQMARFMHRPIPLQLPPEARYFKDGDTRFQLNR